MGAYENFLASKAILDSNTGIECDVSIPEEMFAFQADITKWALRRGRAAIFAGTGLGKSFMELVWADQVVKHTGRPVLHLAPLAVTDQMASEAVKFGIAAQQVRTQADCLLGNNIVNFQKLDHFDLSRFGGVILDESSILKSTDGHYRTRLIAECQRIPFRLAATATPAPNDFMELGNHAEFLGVMSYTDMLATFFTHDGGETQKWRLKGHAENEFWRWMASWSVMLRTPSDLGYSNEGYDLPPLHLKRHAVGVDLHAAHNAGTLFPMVAETMQERLAARRATVEARINMAVDLVISSFPVKIEECHGNPNTKQIAASKNSLTPSMPPSASRPSEGHPKKIASTCENTMRQIRTSGKGLPRKKSAETICVEKDTLPTPRLPNSTENQPDQKGNPRPETPILEKSSELVLTSTTGFSPTKAACAPSAMLQKIIKGEGSPSIIAMTQGQSEDCYATTATGGSASLRTIPTDWIKQSSIYGSREVKHWVIWCHLNKEQDALKSALGDLAISIQGSNTDEEKIRLHDEWIAGKAPVLICKPSMFAHGLNWQHCHQCIFVGLNDSWEQYYQAIRRFWRFGQVNPVTAHLIAAETEGNVVANLRRKEADADRMMAAMIKHTQDISSRSVRGLQRERDEYTVRPCSTPSFLSSARKSPSISMVS